MRLEIVTPERTVYAKENVKMVITHAAKGDIGILPNHAPLISTLEPTIVRVKLGEDQEEKVAVSGGFLEVRSNQVTILAEAAELPSEIDVERAKAAKERAEKRLKQKEKIDAVRAELSLKRALNRLKATNG
jgi:F-type H+-transporting ATPase subunit epsilon